jgi:hypothetical protein
MDVKNMYVTLRCVSHIQQASLVSCLWHCHFYI